MLDPPWLHFFTLNEVKTITVSVQVLPILCHIKELSWLNKIISSSQFCSSNATISAWQHYLFINHFFFFFSPHYFSCRWLKFMAGKCFIAKLGNSVLGFCYAALKSHNFPNMELELYKRLYTFLGWLKSGLYCRSKSSKAMGSFVTAEQFEML